MAEKLFTKALIQNLEDKKIEINEKKIYELGISSARVTNACLMAVVNDCKDHQPIRVDVQYNGQDPQVIDLIAPKKGDKISINITEELNCLIKFAFQYSGNPEHDDKILIIFDSNIVLEDIDLFVEYIPEQIMHENSAYVDFDVRQAGSGQVNLATGLLRFKHQCGEIGLVYNNWQNEKRSTTVYDAQGKKTKFRHGVGKGFKLNVEQFLIKRKGTENQTIYTYVDSDGNYHEFSEKYYYLNDQEQRVFVPRTCVKIDLDGRLKYVIDSKHAKEVKVELKSTNGLILEQDNSIFEGGKYIEQRQKEQVELEENIAALARQLKQYVIVDKGTGKKINCYDELSNPFRMSGVLSVANYERFLARLTENRLLLTESEALQYSSLLLQQTSDKYAATPELEIAHSTFNKETNYSDGKNQERNSFKRYTYDKKLINLRRLVSDLRKDYALLTQKSNHLFLGENNQYQYDSYIQYLKAHNYTKDNCCIDIAGVGRGNAVHPTRDTDNLTINECNKEGVDNLTIKIDHIDKMYCDLQAELERIGDDLDAYLRSRDKDTRVPELQVRQKVVEQRLRLFQKEFANRTDKLQANINKFETEIEEFIEKEQRILSERQIAMVIESSVNNKEDLEKYFKQYHNKMHQLTKLKWQLPKYYITGKDGVIMGFNKDGYLVSLTGSYDHHVAIIYSKGRISSIKDSENNVLSIEYGKNRRIKKIVTSDAKTYQLFYENKTGLLTRIVDGNNEETYLGYDKYGFLNSIEDNFHFGAQFSYDKYGRVVTVKQTSQIESVSESIVMSENKQERLFASIDYHDTHMTTSVTNSFGVTTTYNFDILGKVVTMYEGEYSDPEETTRAKSFEYTDSKISFVISDNIGEENLIKKTQKITLLGTVQNIPREAVKTIDVTNHLLNNDTTDYVFSVWAKADSAYVESARSSLYNNDKINKIYGITNDEAKHNRKFEVRAKVTYQDGEKAVFIAAFDWLNTNWQYVAMPIEVKKGKKLSKCVIALDYSNNVGEAIFDCLSLREGSWTYKEFDDNGKLLYSEDSASKTVTKYFYDDDDRLIKEELTDSKGRVFTGTREYNAQGVLIRSINYAGLVEETIFDENGRELKKITYNVDDPSSKFYEESKRDDKGKITADVDESGEYDSVTYTYNQKDEAAVKTDGSGNKTAFGYKDGKLISISGSADGVKSTNLIKYNVGLITKETNEETQYSFTYDNWGRNTKVEITGQVYAEIQHIDDLHSKTILASNDIVETVKNKRGNTISQIVTYNNKEQEHIQNFYAAETENLMQTSIDINGVNVYNIKYKYNSKGQTVEEARDGKFALTKQMSYTVDGDLESTKYSVGGEVLTYNYETDNTPDKRDAKVKLPFNITQQLAYDGLGRTKEIALGENLAESIYYAQYGDHATNRINSVWYGVNGIRKENARYTYDKAGNIETVTENGELVARYTYDGLNRIVREDNIYFGTFTYQYDTAGNILSKRCYEYTLSDKLEKKQSVREYAYNQRGWKDQLLSFNGEACEYDVLGNPIVYRGRKLAWKGRKLLSYSNDEYSANYTYDVSGVRTSKVIKKNKETVLQTRFIYDGNSLVAEQRDSKWLYYLYGVDGLAGFNYKGTNYLFRKNLQGDITHIYKELDKTLHLVAQYVYDAWGKCSIITDIEGIATINPFRYRSYYFDDETQLYYLQTRYYDPEAGRFISADNLDYLKPETLGGLNLYAYCGNNPVMAVDFMGTDFLGFLKKAGKVIGGALLTLAGGVVTLGGILLSGAPVLGGTVTHIGTAMAAYGVITVASVFDEQVQQDMDAIHWNPFNLDADTAIKSEKVSFYRGMPVIRFDSDFLSSFQVGGLIFFEHGESVNALKHESGHGVQEAILGVPRYLIHIALPSVIMNLIGRKNTQLNNLYYNFPWERTADWFGGVERKTGASKHLDGSLEFGIIYFILSILF